MVSVETTQHNALPSHLAALAMDEFPQPAGSLRTLGCESSHAGRHREARFTCSKITEDVNEEGVLDEDSAHRTFQRSLESLQRCTRARQWLTYRDSTSIASVDSSDSDSA